MVYIYVEVSRGQVTRALDMMINRNTLMSVMSETASISLFFHSMKGVTLRC